MRRGSVLLISVVSVAVGLLGCEDWNPIDPWNLGPYPPSYIDPELGRYEISTHDCFSVIEDGTGGKCVLFSTDCYRFDGISIVNGAFEHTWGQIGGTHCPTDGYKIVGYFETPTLAKGIIKYAYDCRSGSTSRFTATRYYPTQVQ